MFAFILVSTRYIHSDGKTFDVFFRSGGYIPQIFEDGGLINVQLLYRNWQRWTLIERNCWLFFFLLLVYMAHIGDCEYKNSNIMIQFSRLQRFFNGASEILNC